MRYSLRTLLILAAVAPPLIYVAWALFIDDPGVVVLLGLFLWFAFNLRCAIKNNGPVE